MGWAALRCSGLLGAALGCCSPRVRVFKAPLASVGPLGCFRRVFGPLGALNGIASVCKFGCFRCVSEVMASANVSLLFSEYRVPDGEDLPQIMASHRLELFLVSYK